MDAAGEDALDCNEEGATMANGKTSSIVIMAVAALGLISAANFGYAGFLFLQGREDNIAQIISGLLCGSIAIAVGLRARSRR
jgi:hypothetical protein